MSKPDRNLLSETKRILPKFARGLTHNVSSLAVLIERVEDEVEAYCRGDNPLTPGQADALRDWLQKVQP